jgi:peptidoglycan/LPS O-acetylase OafA/YrhL
MTAQRPPTARIPQLELLRVLAMGGIFLFHLWTVIPLSSDSRLLGPWLARLPLLGTLGVIIFNGITGFVLAVPYLGQPHPRPAPGGLAFFRARFGRVCRQYYPTLLLWTIPWVILTVHEQSWHFLLLAFATHLVFLHTLHASTFFAIVPAFWWLGLLAQFYLVYPWLLRLFQRVGPGRACLMACIIPWLAWGGLTYLASQEPGSTVAMVHYLSYFNLPVRLPEFALGMWLASAWNRAVPLLHGRQDKTAPLALIAGLILPLCAGVLLFLLLDNALVQQLIHPFDHIYLVCWCLGSTLVVLRWPLAFRLGTAPFILDLAAASYGIYLIHQPLLGYANQWLSDLVSPPGRFLVLLIGVGWLCYRAAVGLNGLVNRLWR